MTQPVVLRNQYPQVRSCLRFLYALLFAFVLTSTNPAWAITATVAYQPMVSNGLAAGQPFEAWIVLDRSLEPTQSGYAVPSGATMRFTFPKSFRVLPHVKPEAVLLYGWPQKAIAIKFDVALDPQDPQTVVITVIQPIEAGSPDKPGLKAIHLRTGEVNPPIAGKYPIEIEFTNAGELSGKTKAIASITKEPVPNIAAYNQLHDGRNEDWQRVKHGETALLPIDLLITLPQTSRSSVSLHPAENGVLEILSDERPIGTITTKGVPLILKPEGFGPGFARLGIVRFRVTTGATPGIAEIRAQLTGGPAYSLHIVVEP